MGSFDDRLDAANTSEDTLAKRLDELAQHSRTLAAIEAFVLEVEPVALELGLQFAPGGSALATILGLIQKGGPTVLAKLGKA